MNLQEFKHKGPVTRIRLRETTVSQTQKYNFVTGVQI